MMNRVNYNGSYIRIIIKKLDRFHDLVNYNNYKVCSTQAITAAEYTPY